MTRERLSEEERAIFEAVSDEFDIIEEVERILTGRVTAARLAAEAAENEACAALRDEIISMEFADDVETAESYATAIRSRLTAPQVSALERVKAEARSEGAEVAWLIERGGMCLGFCEYRFTWVTFTNDDALRFHRQRDAYSFIQAMKWKPFNLPLENTRVTEHSWSVILPAPVVPDGR